MNTTNASGRESAVRIGLLYPDLLGTYGDRGNATVLGHRLARRGMPFELVTVRATDPCPASLDVYLIGGGEDHAEDIAARLLHESPLVDSWRDGASIVAICAGFQLLGTTMTLTSGERVPGLGVIDATTTPGRDRRVGDVVLDASGARLGALSGFENHRGVTTVHGDVPPLGVVRATGRPEGVLGDRLLATYLHGPVLVRNPALADRVLEWTVGPLAPLGDDPAQSLHHTLVTRFGTRRARRLAWRRPQPA
jgi:CobQ-like glutamine amidotransferase family enzyme